MNNMRDDVHSIKDSSSPSANSRDMNLLSTPQKDKDKFRLVPSKFPKDEEEKELENMSNISNVSETAHDPEEEEKMLDEDQNQDDDDDHNEGDKISKLLSKDTIKEEEENGSESPSLLRARSEIIVNKSIRKEIEEYLFNTHIDEYNRNQEINEWHSKKREFYSDLDRLIDYHVHEIVDHIFKEKELQMIFKNQNSYNNEEVWKKRFLEYIIKAIRLVKPSERLMKDSMNINDYVTINLIEHENDSKCKYINGCVIKNNIADRRMRSEITNPKILLIGNSIGFTQEDS